MASFSNGTSTTSTKTASATATWLGYPEPSDTSSSSSSIPRLSAEEVAGLIKDRSREAGRDYLLVDVRRGDAVVGCMMESIGYHEC